MRMLTILISLGCALAQQAPESGFEVASIKLGDPGREAIEATPTSLNMRHIRLTNCIAWAYKMAEYQVSGPGWMNDAWYEVWAKTGEPVKDPELRAMLQKLLSERLGLSLHRQNKEMSALILTVGKNGHKMEAAEKEGSPSFETGKMKLKGQGATIAQLTEFLSRELRFPVVDQTGLTGLFNYSLDINAYVTEEILKTSAPGGGPPTDAPTIVAQAMQAQLGLKLDSKKASIEVLNIDHVEKTPTGN